MTFLLILFRRGLLATEETTTEMENTGRLKRPRACTASAISFGSSLASTLASSSCSSSAASTSLPSSIPISSTQGMRCQGCPCLHSSLLDGTLLNDTPTAEDGLDSTSQLSFGLAQGSPACVLPPDVCEGAAEVVQQSVEAHACRYGTRVCASKFFLLHLDSDKQDLVHHLQLCCA